MLHDRDGLGHHLGRGHTLLIATRLLARLDARRVDLKRKRHTTLQVEAEFELTLRSEQLLLQDQDVTLRLIGFADEILLVVEEREEIHATGATLAFTDITESLVIGDRLLIGRHGRILVVTEALLGFGVNLFEGRLILDDLRRDEFLERGWREGVELVHGNCQRENRYRHLPEPSPGCHGYVVVKGWTN